MVTPFIPLFVRELGVKDVGDLALWSGILFSTTTLGNSVMAPFWGAMADRFGRKLMLARALSSVVIYSFLAAQVGTIFEFWLLRFFLGVFSGSIPLSYAIIATSSPRDQVGRAVALLQTAQIVSTAIGPLFGGPIADMFGVRVTFYATFAFALLSIALLLVGYRDTPVKAAQPVADPASPPPRRWAMIWSFLPFVFLLILAQTIERSFQPIVPLYVEQLGTPSNTTGTVAGLVVSLGAFATAISAIAFARAARKRSPYFLLLASMVAGSLLCLPIAFARDAMQLTLLRVLLGLAAGGGISLTYSLAARTVLAGSGTGKASFLSSGLFMGAAAGPLIAGALARYDLRSVFVADALLFGVGLAIMLAFVKRKE